MYLPQEQALWLLLPALPFGLWIAWTDLKFMRITNRAVLSLTACFLVLAPFVMPFDVYLWRLLQVVVVLAVGFVMNAFGLIGGGDAKYAAAMAGFFDLADSRFIVLLFAAMVVGAYATHRIAMRIGFVRALTPDWKSWTAGKDFPMGLALSGTLILYLLLALAY